MQTVVLGKRRASLCEEPARVHKLPARSMLYCPVARAAGAVAGSSKTAVEDALTSDACEFALALPSGGWPGAHRVVEFALLRSVLLHVANARPADEAVRAHGLDGWCSADGRRVSLLDPRPLLRMVDDDKRSGLAQAYLRDLWASPRKRGTPG